MTNAFYTPGWVADPAAVRRVQAGLPHPTFATTPTFAALASADLPERVFTWQAYERLFSRKTPCRQQGRVGSCVSFGTAAAVERTMACEIAAGEPEEFRDLAQEVIYGGSRVEVGGGRLRGGDGSVGAWAAEFVRRWGVVARGRYGSHDLSAYSESLCRRYGDDGVPDDLEPEAKLHPCTDVAQVRTLDEAQIALAAGHGIAVCSQQGFAMRRDANGACEPSGSWAHCMAADGYAPIDGELHVHIDNSWGPDAHIGPVGPGEPSAAGFWCRGSVFARMLAQDDSWAFAGLAGWRTSVLPLWLF